MTLPWFDTLTTTHAVVGALTTIVGTIGGAVIWLRRSVKSVVKDAVDPTLGDHSRRIEALEGARQSGGQAMDDLSERLDGVERVVNDLQTTVRQLPTRDDLHQVQLRVTQLQGQLETMGAVVKRIEGTLNTLDTFLRERN